VVELDDTSGDGDGQKMVTKCSNFKRRKRKIKSYEAQGKCINMDFVLLVKTQ
jgi:hypothetical protein